MHTWTWQLKRIGTAWKSDNQTGREVLCLQTEVKNKSFQYILNINSCYITMFCYKKHFFWKLSICSVDKYSHISSSAVQQRKDEVELKKKESEEAFTLMCRMNEESGCDQGGTKLWFRAHMNRTVTWDFRLWTLSVQRRSKSALRSGLIETDLSSTWILSSVPSLHQTVEEGRCEILGFCMTSDHLFFQKYFTEPESLWYQRFTWHCCSKTAIQSDAS